MKLTTIAMATALALTSSAAMAQMKGTGGYGPVVQPSVDAYSTPVGPRNVVPAWRNTGPAAPLPSSPTSMSVPLFIGVGW